MCLQSLHRNHALANGAHMTGDATVGYTMHLRPANGTGPGTVALRKFMEIVNGAARSPAAPPQQRPAGVAHKGLLRDDVLTMQLIHASGLTDSVHPNASAETMACAQGGC